MKDPATLKTFLYICSALVGLAGTFFGIGRWASRKNHDAQEICELKQQVETNEKNAKSRMFKEDGEPIYARAVDFQKFQKDNRAEHHEIEKKQQSQEVTLVSIDLNVKMLVGLMKDVLAKND